MDFVKLMENHRRVLPEPSPAQLRDEKRADLLGQVCRGEIQPAQAEEEWRQVSSKPLRRIPAEFTVDRETAAMWTPEMVAIWFATKGDNRSLHRHFRGSSDNADWWRPNAADDQLVGMPDNGPGSKGYYLADCERTRLFESFYDFDGQWQEFPPQETWYPRLQEYLIAGEITAVGCRLTDTDDIQETIPSQYWVHAAFESDEWDIFVRSEKAQYRRVLFPGREVLACQTPTGASHSWNRHVKLEKDDLRIFEELKIAYPYSFPAFTSRKERDAMVSDALHEKTLARWTMNAKNTDKAEKGVRAFARAMDRLFDKIILDPSKLP